MNDCPNADVRELLPDLLHGRLDPAARAMVESHLERCADCRAELALLRDLRASFRQTPALNLAAISAAVQPRHAPVRRSWAGWRVAVAITVVAAGASSLLVMRNASPVPDTVSVAVVSTERAPSAEGAPAAVRGGRELAMAGGSLPDLSDRELASLLKEIESLDAVPSTEVENTAISPIAPRR